MIVVAVVVATIVVVGVIVGGLALCDYLDKVKAIGQYRYHVKYVEDTSKYKWELEQLCEGTRVSYKAPTKWHPRWQPVRDNYNVVFGWSKTIDDAHADAKTYVRKLQLDAVVKAKLEYAATVVVPPLEADK